jgi:hypothetical protein
MSFVIDAHVYLLSVKTSYLRNAPYRFKAHSKLLNQQSFLIIPKEKCIQELMLTLGHKLQTRGFSIGPLGIKPLNKKFKRESIRIQFDEIILMWLFKNFKQWFLIWRIATSVKSQN